MMQDEGALAKMDVPTGSIFLLNLIKVFLKGPDPDVQHKLTLFHADHYLTILADLSHPKQVMVVCCSSLKNALDRRNDFISSYASILGTVEALYQSCDEKMADLLELVLDKIFTIYLDDQKKLQAFEGVTERLAASNDIRMCEVNQRVLKIAQMLVRAMSVSSLNNQICVGALFCYLKQLYYSQHRTNEQYNPNGRGFDLLLEAMHVKEVNEPILQYIRMQIQIIRLLREIIEKVQEDQDEESIIPAAYLRNSKQLENLLTKIICATGNNRIYGDNDTINEFKSEVLQLFSDNFMYHVNQAFLVSAITTITASKATELTDHSNSIVSTLLLLIQRSTSYPDYAQAFFGCTQILVLKLFELISAQTAERDALDSDPEHFAQIADDFCKTQQSQSLKARAGSLIYNLCMFIDGNLTFVTNFALIALYDLERRAVQALGGGAVARPEVSNSGPAMKQLLDLWTMGAQSLTETSLIVLSSISDLLNKRAEFNRVIQQHLKAMLGLFRHRQTVLAFVPPIVLCRYIQLASYFSSPGCLDPFVPLFDVHQGVAHSLLKALETVIQFHDKKNADLRAYVSSISAKILLLSDKLTPLLQTTIISRPELLLCVKQRLVEKLVVWLLKYTADSNVFASNKISNLLCKVIEQYPNYLSKLQEQTLAHYLTPLYRQLVKGQQFAVEQCVVDVAVAHAQILKTSLNMTMAGDFIKIAVSVVNRNNGVLNKCLELFSQLLGTAHMKQYQGKKAYDALRQVNLWVARQVLGYVKDWLKVVEVRDQNIWQLACLVQLLLGTFQVTGEPINCQILDFSKLFELCMNSHSRVVHIKALIVALLLMRLSPNAEVQGWIASRTLPSVIPPTEKDHLCVYILRSIHNFNLPEIKAKMLTYALSFMLPSQHLQNYFANYQQRIHVIGSNTDECQVFAYQAIKDIRHPLACWPTDVYDEFRMMFEREKEWESVRVYLVQGDEEKMRMALSTKLVGKNARKIVRVKPLKL